MIIFILIINIFILETRAVVKPWVGKKDDKDKDNSGPPPKPGPPLPSPSSNLTDDKKMKKEDPPLHHVSAPYPQRGIILQSLNYIQLDVLNTPHIEIEPDISLEKGFNDNGKSGLVTGALNYIEKDVRGVL